jgi:DNA-binding ferritin-like protein
MNAKKVVLCLLMLCSITFVKAQTAVNEVSSVTEMSGEIITKVKLAKEYFITSTDPDVGRTFDERVANLSKKVKVLFQEYRDTRTAQIKKDSINTSQDIRDVIENEEKNIRQVLHYMNLPTDL